MMFGAGEALDLLDWKRQIFRLYEEVRANPDPRSAWELWRGTRDQLYRGHPQSPLPAERRAGFPGCSYFAYDPQARVLAWVEPGARVHRDERSSTGAAFPFSSVGTARFTLADEEHSLALLWNEGYGGGLFVSFQDETNGQETYPAARYLLDTVKGADPTTPRAPTTAHGPARLRRLKAGCPSPSGRGSGLPRSNAELGGPRDHDSSGTTAPARLLARTRAHAWYKRCEAPRPHEHVPRVGTWMREDALPDTSLAPTRTHA
jgi:hypothetical protein